YGSTRGAHRFPDFAPCRMQACNRDDGPQHHVAIFGDISGSEAVFQREPDIAMAAPRRPAILWRAIHDSHLVHEHADDVDHGGDQGVAFQAEPLDQTFKEMRRGEQGVFLHFVEDVAAALAQGFAAQVVKAVRIELAAGPHRELLGVLDHHHPAGAQGGDEQVVHHPHPRTELLRVAVDLEGLLPVADPTLDMTPQAARVAVTDGVVWQF
ncbi:MAG: hypothetical protein ACK56I_13700, partial [bacterium]